MQRRWTDNSVIMDTQKELLDIIREFVELPEEGVNLDDGFRTAVGLDSFIFLSMISSIEEHFGIAIPNSDLACFSTLGDIVSYIDGRRAAA